MADKKKMSVAEILAAARKADSQAARSAELGARSGEVPSQVEQVPHAEVAVAAQEAPADTVGAADTAPAETTPVKAEKPSAKPKPAGAGGRPSVAEMIAAARAGGKTKA